MRNFSDRIRLYVTVHNTFLVSLAFKGADAVLEVVSGVLFLLIKPSQISYLVRIITQYELSEDPHDLIANYLIKMAGQLSVNTQIFGSLYLISHGVVKVWLVWALWRRKLWAYPAAMIVFFLFIVYQIYRYSHTYSLLLLALTILDMAVIVLTWLEYKRLKNEFARR